MKDDLSNKNIITEIDPDSKDYTELDYDQLDRLAERMDRLEEMIRQTSSGAVSADTEIRPEPPEVEEAAIEQPEVEVSAAGEPVAAPAAGEPRKPAKSSKSGKDAAKTSKSGMDAAKTASRSGRFGTMLVNFLAFYVAIMFWELFLYNRTNGSMEGFPVWTALFALAEAMVCAFATGWIKNKVANRIGNTLVMLIVWFYYAAQLVFHRIFGSLFSVSMIGNAGNALTDFRWALVSELKQSWVLILISLIPVIIYALATFLCGTHIRYGLKPHAAALVLAVGVWALAAALLPSAGTEDTSAYYAYHSKLIDTDTAASRIGVLANSLIETRYIIAGDTEEPETEPVISYAVAADADDTDAMDLDLSPNTIKAIDFRKLAEKANNGTVKSLCDYFAQDKGTSKNDYTGLFEGYNLIYICAEAFSNLAIHEQVTPTLYKMAHEGIVLNNYYNSYHNITTNGEYSLLTGLWPDTSRDAGSGARVGSMPRSASRLMPFGLGTMFSQQCGTTSRGYHNYLGYYYGRNKSLPNLGFTCKFMRDGMTFTSNWPASDYEMMQQSIPDYINDDRFCVYYMTFSGHGPYNGDNVMRNRNIKTVKEILGDTKLREGSQSYLACNYEFDKAMAYLLEELEKAGKLNNTVIVISGDHYPYNLNYPDRDSLAGKALENTIEMYKSSAIIWCGMLKDPIYVDDVCCNVDIFPTILNLFGLEYDSRLIMGRDIFADTEHYAMLYNKCIITNEMQYNAKNGKVTWAEGNTMTEEERKAYLDKYKTLAANRYSTSLKMENTDFYRFVWDNTEF